MKVIADQKRRIVLPKSVSPGDAFEFIETGDRIVIEKLKRPESIKPPVSTKPLDRALFKNIDLDEPSFPPLSSESAY
mgnify:CR=1 FL=1